MRDHLLCGRSFACASRSPAAEDSMLLARASAAHPVAAAEIHWSCSNGKPLWKYGWNPAARLRTCQEPSGYWVLSRYCTPRRCAKSAVLRNPVSRRACRATPVECASLPRFGLPAHPPSLRCWASSESATFLTASFATPAAERASNCRAC